MFKIIRICGLLGFMLLVACRGATTPTINEPNRLAGVPTPSLAPEPTDTPISPPTQPLSTATLRTEPTAIVPTPIEMATASTTAVSITAVSQTTNLTIPGADDLPIFATLYTTSATTPRPGIILLHMLNDNRQVWAKNGQAEELAANGYVVLAVDMRGHGETGGGRDWELAREDLRLVWRWFVEREDVDAEQTAVIGGSIGANMALLLGVDETAVQTVILLSPGIDYRGVKTESELIAFGDRPLLIVASEEDSYAADSSRTLFELAGTTAQLEMYTNAGHGTNMFTAKPELTALILLWLADNV